MGLVGEVLEPLQSVDARRDEARAPCVYSKARFLIPPMVKISGLQRRLLRGGFSTLVMRVYTLGVTLAMHSFLTRSLPNAEYGRFIVGINTMIFLSILAMGGMNQSIVKFVSGDACGSLDQTIGLWKRIRKLVLFTLLIVGCVGAVALTGPFGARIGLSRHLVLPVVACACALAFQQLLGVGLRSLHAMPFASLVDGRSGGGVSKTIFFALCVLTVFSGQVLSGRLCFLLMLIGLVCTLPFGGLLLSKTWRKYSKRRMEAEADIDQDTRTIPYGEIAGASTTLLLTQVLAFLTTQSGIWLAGGYASAPDTALYGSARWLVLQTMAPLQVLNAALASSIAQLYSQGRRVELENMMRSTATISAIVTLSTLGFLVVFNQFVLRTLYGDFYANAGVVLCIFAAGQAVRSFGGNSGQMLALSGKFRAILIINLVATIFQISCGIWSIQNYGIRGLAISTTMVTICVAVAQWVTARYLSGVWTHPTVSPLAAFRSLGRSVGREPSAQSS